MKNEYKALGGCIGVFFVALAVLVVFYCVIAGLMYWGVGL